jgi:hypothetical protein
VITIHVDSVTYEKAKTLLLSQRRNINVEIKLDMDYPDASWQELKLKLLKSLNGTMEFYLDADLRWNGPMPSCHAITFFTTEFQLKRMTIYLLLLTKLRNGKYLEASMRNTSFFTFAGNKLSEDLLDDVDLLHGEIIEIIDTESFGVEDQPQLIRIAEQIALSTACEDWGVEVTQLKEIDGWKDGSFVESSYFGSTGTSF